MKNHGCPVRKAGLALFLAGWGIVFLVAGSGAKPSKDAISHVGESGARQESDDLPAILGRCAAYCAKVRAAALHFVCEEKIDETLFEDRARMVSSKTLDDVTYTTVRAGRNRLLFDYQLIKREGTLEEKRTLLEFNGKKPDAPNASLKPRRFQSSNPVFGPVGFFDENWHEFYEYRLNRKHDRLLGREAYVIKVTPKIEIENKPNHGTLWVDTEDAGVLKIEVDGSSLAGYDDVAAEAKRHDMKPDFVVIHEYGVSRNSVRFPSRTWFLERYQRLGGETFRSRTEILYENYRFFMVETEAVIK